MIINKQELIDLLKYRKGAFPVTIIAETIPQMKQKDNPYVGTKKVSKVNGIANFIYKNSVDYQRIREKGKVGFTPHPRIWGKRIPKTPLVEHKGKLYLELKIQKVLQTKYKLSGQTVAENDIKPFLRKKNRGRQDLQKPVVLADYNLDNIKEVHCFGRRFKVEG